MAPLAQNSDDACRFERRLDIRQLLTQFIADAPEPVRTAIVHLIVSVKTSLDILDKRPILPDLSRPVRDWGELLTGLTELLLALDQIKSSRAARLRLSNPQLAHLAHRFELLQRAYEQSTLMIEILYALIAAGHEFTTAEDVLEKSAEILVKELEADLYVCRLQDDEGDWINVAASDAQEKQTPIFVWAMEDSLPNHPVMSATHERGVFHVLSNDLRGLERGGESVDCMAYREGYRSRLAFVLRSDCDALADCEAFGLIMLYSHQPGFFDRFDAQFLADASKIISLTVGRQLDLGKDALAKAAGGMAHVGNNVLGIMENYNSMVLEELEDAAAKVKTALARPLPGPKNPQEMLQEVENLRALLTDLHLGRNIDALNGVTDAIWRLKAAIDNLLSQVNRPVLMPYVRGEEVLDLEPTQNSSRGYSS